MYSFGDIYLTKFSPSAGKEFAKIRPAIVIQESFITATSPYVTVMPISSKIESFKKLDIYIAKDLKNHLLVDSLIKTRQISSFDKSRLIKKIGTAASPTVRSVRGYLRKHFGL